MRCSTLEFFTHLTALRQPDDCVHPLTLSHLSSLAWQNLTGANECAQLENDFVTSIGPHSLYNTSTAHESYRVHYTSNSL